MQGIGHISACREMYPKVEVACERVKGGAHAHTRTHTHTGSLITKYYLQVNGTQAGTSGTPLQTAAHALTCDNLAKSAHMCACLHICSKSH